MSIFIYGLGIIIVSFFVLNFSFRMGFYAGAFQILSKGQPLDSAIEKHGNPFVKQEWKLFIKTVAPGRIDSRFSSHVKRVLKLKRE